MEKVLLLIDDQKDYLVILDNIKSHLYRTESILLINKYINPNDRKFWNDNKDPDIDKLISGIISELNLLKPNLIIVDQYYSGNTNFNGFNGIDVIEKLRGIPKFQQCPIFLISGRRRTIIKEIFNSSVSEDDKVNQLAKIINLRIDRFLDKDFESEAIKHLKQIKLDEILPIKLRNYEGENAMINCFSPKYRTLTLSELADIIESDIPETEKILDEMFGLTLSHYININEKL